MILLDSINVAKRYLGEEHFLNLNINFEVDDDTSILKVVRKNNDITIRYGQVSSLFRGLTFIIEHIQENEYSYSFSRLFKTSGIMLDFSRNGVLKNELVEEMILIHALSGNNRLLFYIEDTYQLDKYPYFGYLRGGYSKEDIKHFSSYASSFGIELIPCIQTLGHFYNVLKWEPMAKYKDGNTTLIVGEEDTYKLIEEMIKFCKDSFISNEIHIGMDESSEMGLGRYLHKYGFSDRVKMFSQHLSKVIEICKKYDLEPMIWSDMYFRLNSVDEDYYLDSPLPKETLDLIPRDVKLVYWDYYHDSVEDYEKMIKFHKDTDNDIIFAGGAWKWKGYAPSLRISLDYTKYALEACRKHHIKDTFITAWGDDGAECPMFSILPIIIESGYLSFNNCYDEKEISRLLKALSGLSIEQFMLLDLPDMPEGKNVSGPYNPSKYLLYQDVLLGMFDSTVKDNYAFKYEEYAKLIAGAKNISPKFSYIYDLLSSLCDVLSKKVDLGLRLRKAYKNKNNEELRHITNDIDGLLTSLNQFEEALYTSWHKEYKATGYEVLDGRLGFLKNRVKTTKRVIKEYLDGHIDNIEELEMDILPYDGKDGEDIVWNYWFRNVSPHH